MKGVGRTLPCSLRNTSLMASSAPLVTEVTSADIQAWSLSSNQTRVPFEYMCSAMATCWALGDAPDDEQT